MPLQREVVIYEPVVRYLCASLQRVSMK